MTPELAASWAQPIDLGRNDEIEGDLYTYNDGCTVALLRSGTDGPHAALADRLCNVRTETE